MKNKTNFALHFDETCCTGCVACVSACNFGAIDFTDKPEINVDLCRLCGSCVSACPVEALSMDEAMKADPAAEGGDVWVLAEANCNGLAPVTMQLLGEARRLADELHVRVCAVLVGYQIAGLADDLVAYGADTVHVLECPILGHHIEEHCAEVVTDLVKAEHPAVLLVGATDWGRGVSARLAAMLHTGLTADCTQLDIQKETGLLLQKRPAFGGNLMATIVTPTHRPQMASVRPGVMQALEKDTNRRGTVQKHDLSSFTFDGRVRELKHMPVADGLDNLLESSKIVVGVGRGVKNRKVLDDICGFARSIGATVAASRAAVERGLLDASVQVGQTGHTIAPDLYIAFGISGQIQHVAALVGAKKMIAVNRDASAPIFQVADYGWVGDIEEALPVLLQTFKTCAG